MAFPPTARDDIHPPIDASDVLQECRVLYLKSLIQLLQENESLPTPATEKFQAGVGRYFDEMTTTQPKKGFDQSNNLTASCISLLGENDLELEIRLGEFSAQLQEQSGGELWRLYLRFITLLKCPDLAPSDNPVGPKGIAEGIDALCSELAENHQKTLERIERLEDHFADKLNALYVTLNDFLATHHVEAAQASLVSTPDTAKSPPASTAANAAAVLQQNLLGPNFPGTAQNTMGNAAASLLSQAMFERLLSRLDELEKIGHLPATNSSPPAFPQPPSESQLSAPLTAESPTPHALKSNDLGIASGAPEAATIDALALIFEAIFASSRLPDAIKSALSSLQIPMLKAAMLDASFFTSDHHPARQLLDKMAHAALGLARDVSARHPLCVSIQAIAGRVRAEFTRDLQVFKNNAEQIDALITKRNQLAEQLIASYPPLLSEFERENQADMFCHQLIEPFCHAPTPTSISTFLRQHWQRLLRSIWLSNGEHSAEWKEHVAVIEQLLWSIQAKTAIDERKQLAKILPAMLKRLNDGMQKLALPEEERTAFLDTCFVLQTLALRAAGTAPTSLPASNGSPPALAEPTYGEIQIGELRLKTCRQLTAEKASQLALYTSYKTGDWLEFKFADQLLCGRLGHINPATQTLLLTNPDWGFAVALPQPLLAEQIRTQQACIASSTSLFNSAAEKALRDTPKRDVLA